MRDETWYIWMRRRPRVLRPDAGAAIEEMSVLSLLLLLIRLTRSNSQNIYLNSTNTSFPFTMLLLKLLCGRGLWCLDMHDDLLYDMKGLRRLRAAIGVKVQSWAADIIIRAAESLHELFPRSIHFGNASQIGWIERSVIEYRSVLVLASLDSRFDFEFMSAVAKSSPGRVFQIYGSVSRDEAHVHASMAALCDAHSNITYHGPYDLASLETILSRYCVSLAPYCTNTRLTRYLDPLRFYHCLNSGMELITTTIPEAERLQDGIHLVHLPSEVESILVKLETSAEAKRNNFKNYQPRTWNIRADDLIHITTDALHARTGQSQKRKQSMQYTALTSGSATALAAPKQGTSNPETGSNPMVETRQIASPSHDSSATQISSVKR